MRVAGQTAERVRLRVTRIFFTFTAMPEIDVSAAPGTPEPPRQTTTGSKAGGGGGSILTKGKWLKITRKGLLVTAMTRIGKEEEGRGRGVRPKDHQSMHEHFFNPVRPTRSLARCRPAAQPSERIFPRGKFLGRRKILASLRTTSVPH